jgi:hypothetical protein
MITVARPGRPERVRNVGATPGYRRSTLAGRRLIGISNYFASETDRRARLIRLSDHRLTNGRRRFGGNFWWARSDLIHRLPPIETETRWDAEGWLGLGDPDIANLIPGQPVSYEATPPESWPG